MEHSPPYFRFLLHSAAFHRDYTFDSPILVRSISTTNSNPAIPWNYFPRTIVMPGVRITRRPGTPLIIRRASILTNNEQPSAVLIANVARFQLRRINAVHQSLVCMFPGGKGKRTMYFRCGSKLRRTQVGRRAFCFELCVWKVLNLIVVLW